MHNNNIYNTTFLINNKHFFQLTIETAEIVCFQSNFKKKM